jgi:hypothetical protein
MAGIPKDLAAKARLKLSDGTEFYIEVRKGSRFSNFYATYTAQGRGRKRVVTAGMPRHRGYADGIEEAVEKVAAIMNENGKRSQHAPRLVSTKIWIHRKRLYRKLISMRPDDLGLTRVSNGLAEYLRRQQSPPVLPSIPLGHTTMEKRWKILTG